MYKQTPPDEKALEMVYMHIYLSIDQPELLIQYMTEQPVNLSTCQPVKNNRNLGSVALGHQNPSRSSPLVPLRSITTSGAQLSRHSARMLAFVQEAHHGHTGGAAELDIDRSQSPGSLRCWHSREEITNQSFNSAKCSAGAQ